MYLMTTSATGSWKFCLQLAEYEKQGGSSSGFSRDGVPNPGRSHQEGPLLHAHQVCSSDCKQNFQLLQQTCPKGRTLRKDSFLRVRLADELSTLERPGRASSGEGCVALSSCSHQTGRSAATATTEWTHMQKLHIFFIN